MIDYKTKILEMLELADVDLLRKVYTVLKVWLEG